MKVRRIRTHLPFHQHFGFLRKERHSEIGVTYRGTQLEPRPYEWELSTHTTISASVTSN